MTRTELQLLAIHKAPVIPLADICERYLDNNRETARRKAAANLLPFPAFQLEPSNQQAPWMVRVQDLAEFLDAAGKAGVKSWQKSQV